MGDAKACVAKVSGAKKNNDDIAIISDLGGDWSKRRESKPF